jgi:starch synthase
MKIVMCASEVVPFAKTGGLADVAGALPLALEELGQDVIIIMPRYKAITDAKYKMQRVTGDISVSTIGKSVKVYFIESEKYYGRDSLYMDKNGDYPDNLDRFSFYCRRTLDLLKEIQFKPDIIHVHDWQACLVPVYLKTQFNQDAFYRKTKAILTIHNIGYQGLFPKEEFPKIGIDTKYFSMDGLEYYGKINILKGGILFSDTINTVSATYSKEIQTKEFGFGLEGVLGLRKNSLFGILNGLDYSIWNPRTDTFIASHFDANDLAGKAVCKEDLQKCCHLPLAKDRPLCGIVSRLADQKGFDLLAEGIDTICKLDLQLVILGTGDQKYHVLLEGIVKKYPKVISLHLKFDDSLAHKIYAGSDIFLMPSKYEPCGLGQLISLKYGTIPVVFATGGLVDTVDKNNGFIFDQYKKDVLVKTIKVSLSTFARKATWGALVQRAMACDFSWAESARQYVLLYEK